jgi:DNA topoisomerase-1
MVIKKGRFGRFLACPGYPECKNTKPLIEELDAKCPKCGSKVVVRRSKKGRKFFGCKSYPECNYMSWDEPVDERCPNCESPMIKKYLKGKGTVIRCTNNECKYERAMDSKSMNGETYE